MINLPKKIDATGYDCLVACIMMVCMYWRVERPTLGWNVPTNLGDPEWDKSYKKGLSYVRSSGLPFNNVRRLLQALKFPLNARLEFLTDVHQLEHLVSLNTPPIVIYDHAFYLKGVKRTPWHAIVMTDKTTELIVGIDPSLSPKYVTKIPETDFIEAWKITQNATIIMSPKTYRIRRVITPSETLEKWMEKSQ